MDLARGEWRYEYDLCSIPIQETTINGKATAVRKKKLRNDRTSQNDNNVRKRQYVRKTTKPARNDNSP
ncbi:hypothetical protein TorRG33x02_232580 [Trema orientale]|uniref:Uncharacterized protein n=1 Tax=Trema orientale TaxID=63057 RepID=A0A2P5E5W3_TREOI|nr:hypothetical protein TorRG33x02_232580 [Trema orientale]